jgi:hypothetical protein
VTAAIPTLFRYPGAEALVWALARKLPSLAPPGATVLWLAEDPLGPAGKAPARFGSIAVLDAAPLAPTPRGDGIWVARPRPLAEEATIWIPPSRIAEGGAPWAGVRTASLARALLGPGYDDERAEILDALCAYLEGPDAG